MVNMDNDDWGMDELDRELEKFRKESDEEENLNRDNPFMNIPDGPRVWRPFDDDEPEEEHVETLRDDNLEMQLSNMEAVRDKLERMRESSRKDYEAVDKIRVREGKAVLSEWGATIAMICIIIIILALTYNTPAIAAWAVLCIVAGIFSLRQVWAMIKRTVNHRILCIQNPTSEFVESRRVNTYHKQQMHAYNRMKEIDEKLETLDRFEKQLRKNGSLSDEEMEEVRRLTYVNNHTSIYVNTKFGVADWGDFLFSKK